MQRILQKLPILALIVLFTLSLGPDIFAKGASGGSRSVSRSYSSRSSSSSSSSKSYTKPSTPTKSSVTPAPAGQQSSSRSYNQSATTSTGSTRQSSAVRQKEAAMSSAKTGSAVSTKGMTASEKRSITAQQRTQTRDLKAENRQLKRQVRVAQRDTARARQQARVAQSPITVNNFGMWYPTPGYGIYSLAASMVFANAIAGIYFHDHYNHMLHHSWLWHYHHADYDRSHWSQEREMEYERWRAYYDSQNLQQNPNYVDPDTNRDEDYITPYVEQNPDQFYGQNAPETVTVEELPDEDGLREIVLASASDTPEIQPVSAQPQRVIVEKKTSGATWFILVFGSLVIIGIVVLVMYNKGYF